MIDLPERGELEQIAALASKSGEQHELTANDVAVVLQAYINIHQGDPITTLLRNPETGEIAHRVAEGGVHMWRVSGPDGSQYNDLEPTLPGWEKIG
jgi:hypothetical protein